MVKSAKKTGRNKRGRGRQESKEEEEEEQGKGIRQKWTEKGN